MMSDMMFMVLDVFADSNGDKTKALYARLDSYGPIGIIGTNLFRAQKNSTRAKVYRGGNRQGSYRGQAYERKEWAIRNPSRGAGPDYPGDWDGIPDQSTTRIVRFIAEQILATVSA